MLWHGCRLRAAMETPQAAADHLKALQQGMESGSSKHSSKPSRPTANGVMPQCSVIVHQCRSVSTVLDIIGEHLKLMNGSRVQLL